MSELDLWLWWVILLYISCYFRFRISKKYVIANVPVTVFDTFISHKIRLTWMEIEWRDLSCFLSLMCQWSDHIRLYTDTPWTQRLHKHKHTLAWPAAGELRMKSMNKCEELTETGSQSDAVSPVQPTFSPRDMRSHNHTFIHSPLWNTHTQGSNKQIWKLF